MVGAIGYEQSYGVWGVEERLTGCSPRRRSFWGLSLGQADSRRTRPSIDYTTCRSTTA